MNNNGTFFNFWNIDTSVYRRVDSLKSIFEIENTQEEKIDSFLIKYQNEDNILMNILIYICENIKNNISNSVRIKLKLIDGDIFNKYLLGVYIFLNSIEEYSIIENLEYEVYDKFDEYFLDKIFVSPEFLNTDYY